MSTKSIKLYKRIGNKFVEIDNYSLNKMLNATKELRIKINNEPDTIGSTIALARLNTIEFFSQIIDNNKQKPLF